VEKCSKRSKMNKKDMHAKSEVENARTTKRKGKRKNPKIEVITQQIKENILRE